MKLKGQFIDIRKVDLNCVNINSEEQQAEHRTSIVHSKASSDRTSFLEGEEIAPLFLYRY
jgi:hypothetical protein